VQIDGRIMSARKAVEAAGVEWRVRHDG